MTIKRQLRRGIVAGARAKPVRRVFRAFTLRRGIPVALAWDLEIDDEFEVHVDGDRTFKYSAPEPVDVVGRYLYWTGLRQWERETWREFIPLARRSRGFVDVGAFTGTYTLVACAANPSIRCVAFEPVPDIYRRLATNVQINGWSDRVTVSDAAVSTEVGTARFHLPARDMPDTGHLEASLRTPDTRDGDWIEVPTTTLSAALPADLHVDLMKVDVEDTEGPVVHGMADVLSEHKPTIIIEFLASGSYREATDMLDDIGYEYYHLTSGGRRSVDRPAPVEGDPFQNFLCVPR